MEKRTKEVGLMVTTNASNLLKDADEKTIKSFLALLEESLNTYSRNKHLSSPNKPMEYMGAFYNALDDCIRNSIENFEKDISKITCKKGCSFCCYINVDITEDEGRAIIDFIGKEKIDLLKNEIEKRKKYTMENYKDIAYKDRKCIFLENDLCSIYSFRPIACRKYMVTNDVSLCNTETTPHETAFAASLKTELLHTVVLQSNETVGNMYEVLNLIIKEMGH